MKSKKSQMEAFGLAIIVILVIIGFLLIVLLRKPNTDSPKKDFIADEMSINFVNSVINTHVEECYDSKYTISDLIRFCTKKENIQCGGLSSCELVNNTLYEIANKTLYEQDFKFRLYTQDLDWNGNDIEFNNHGCNEDSNKGQRGFVAIRLYPEPGDVFLYLDICR